MDVMAAVIFDMDDTLVSTAGLWRRAEETLLAHLGAAWSEELSRQCKGMNALDVAATIYRALKPAGISLEECQRVMREALLAEFATELPEAMRGAVACVKRLAGVVEVEEPEAPDEPEEKRQKEPLKPAPGRRLAVASGSPIEAIESVLAQLEILSLFEVVISSESVNRGKPHPDVFLIAAEKLGVEPGECVVIEDSVVGAQAAKAAGMKCIAVPSGDGAAVRQIRELGARVVGSLEEVGTTKFE
jgi:beta-phosphoglucomutase-like phosphatase (HAD superfamily)